MTAARAPLPALLDDEPELLVRAHGVAPSPREARPQPAFPLFWDDELQALPDLAPLVDGVLFRDSLAALWGMWKTYKSFFALDLAMCVALGLSWHGHETQRGRVLYIVAEGARGMRKRAHAWKQFHGVQGRAGVLFLTSSVHLDTAAQVARLADEVRQRSDADDEPFALIVVDTLARNFAGKENATEDMNAFIRGCDALRAASGGATVLLVHHSGWAGEHSRGNSALPAALDTELTVRKDGDRVTLHCENMKDAAGFADLTFVAMPFADSLILQPAEPLSPKLSDNERRLLTEVQRLSGTSGTSYTKLREAAGLSKSSFSIASSRLQKLVYLRNDAQGYRITDAGVLALRSEVQDGFKASDEPAGDGGSEVHRSLRAGTCEPTLELEGDA